MAVPVSRPKAVARHATASAVQRALGAPVDGSGPVQPAVPLIYRVVDERCCVGADSVH